MKKFRILLQILVLASFASAAHSAEDGYRLWLKYDKISDARVLASYENILQNRFVVGQSATINVIKKELDMAFSGLLGKPLSPVDEPGKSTLVIAKTDELPSGIVLEKGIKDQLTRDGYFIKTQRENNDSSILITAKDDTGLLYGTFHFLRLLQTHADITALHMLSNPEIDLRVLNHWDNLDRTVERGYAGFSLWDWQKLPDYLHPYYHDYARANASIGLNGTVLNNVNANAWILQPLYLKKVAALADAFRPYGIRVYLSIRFSSPIDIGGLPVSDPLDKDVQKWWQDKVKEIYQYVPDFGGFLVKANSEGQPGPGDYGRSHADGANMLADALKPYNGVVMWRAFVYDTNNKDDRAKQAYSEFKPLDGTFRDNVLVQVKNGPIDFQPREPFHPMFGGMPSTPLMMEFQITKEYLGFATHNVYLAPLFEEVLRADTYAQGKGSTVAKVIDGSLDGHKISGIAGVANTGTDRNWTGTIFLQSNWYAFGRLAWDHELTSAAIAEEWIKMTLSHNPVAIKSIKKMMLDSREICVNYMTPLGLHHMMGWGHHYGPAPWIKDKPREEWTSVYYHRADKEGIGFNRTKSGSDALGQYFEPVQHHFGDLKNCPEEFLLWFHHLPWDYKLKSGKTLWDELCYHYYEGARAVSDMGTTWRKLEGQVNPKVFNQIDQMLKIQEKEAIWWRNACVLYFQTFSDRPIPGDLEMPEKTLEYYQNLQFPFAPM